MDVIVYIRVLMSTYKYSMFDYHAIAETEITIDGITVLAGDNGCGKSTLSRWLYYLVNGTIVWRILKYNLMVCFAKGVL